MRKNYILVAVEYFTNWLIVWAVKYETVDVAVKFNSFEIVDQFGCSKMVTSDFSLMFTSATWKIFLKKGAAKVIKVASCSLQADGQVVSMAQSVRRALSRMGMNAEFERHFSIVESTYK